MVKKNFFKGGPKKIVFRVNEKKNYFFFEFFSKRCQNDFRSTLEIHLIFANFFVIKGGPQSQKAVQNHANIFETVFSEFFSGLQTFLIFRSFKTKKNSAKEKSF